MRDIKKAQGVMAADSMSSKNLQGVAEQIAKVQTEVIAELRRSLTSGNLQAIVAAKPVAPVSGQQQAQVVPPPVRAGATSKTK